MFSVAPAAAGAPRGPVSEPGPLADLLDQAFETLVFLHPCSDLLEQVLGHIHRACLTLLLEGEVVGLCTARRGGRRRRLAAAFLHLRQAGRQQRPAGTSRLSRLSSIRRTSVGWLGTRIDGPLGLPVSDLTPRKARKTRGAKKKLAPRGPGASTEVLLFTYLPSRCDKFPISSEWPPLRLEVQCFVACQ